MKRALILFAVSSLLLGCSETKPDGTQKGIIIRQDDKKEEPKSDKPVNGGLIIIKDAKKEG